MSIPPLFKVYTLIITLACIAVYFWTRLATSGCTWFDLTGFMVSCLLITIAGIAGIYSIRENDR